MKTIADLSTNHEYPPVEADVASRHLDNHEDVNFFVSSLGLPDPGRRAAQDTPAPNMLSELGEQLSQATDRVTKGLRAFSKGGNLKEMRDYPSRLSETTLLTQVMVKSISKTAQSVDKICNLS